MERAGLWTTIQSCFGEALLHKQDSVMRETSMWKQNEALVLISPQHGEFCQNFGKLHLLSRLHDKTTTICFISLIYSLIFHIRFFILFYFIQIIHIFNIFNISHILFTLFIINESIIFNIIFVFYYFIIIVSYLKFPFFYIFSHIFTVFTGIHILSHV